MVGVNAYYFDGNFVALSFQSARKNDVEFRWTSKEAALAMQAFIRELDGKKHELEVDLLVADEEISSFWLQEQGKDHP